MTDKNIIKTTVLKNNKIVNNFIENKYYIQEKFCNARTFDEKSKATKKVILVEEKYTNNKKIILPQNSIDLKTTNKTLGNKRYDSVISNKYGNRDSDRYGELNSAKFEQFKKRNES